MQILIVDDAEKPLETLREVITRMGHRVVGVARNGLEAVEQFRRLHPDVVVMDVIMPRMNGLEALRVIRREDPRATVVMACSLRSCATALESEHLGAAFYLTKPYQEPRLRKVIDRIARDARDRRDEPASPVTAG